MFTAADFFVSIIIPCYKQSQYLRDAVGSVLQQTFLNWEVIIVNDGSPDETSEIAMSLIKENPTRKIRLINKINGGLADARNFGIRASEGSWILPLDTDDMLEGTYLEKAFEKIRTNPSKNLIFTNLQQFQDGAGVWDPAEYSLQTLKGQNCFPYASIYKKELWHRAGGYEAALPWAGEDLSLWFDFAKIGLSPARIPERLFLYRIHAGGSMYTKLMLHWSEVEAMVHTLHPEIFTVSELLSAHEKISMMDPATFLELNRKLRMFPNLYAPSFWMGIKSEKQNRLTEALNFYEQSNRLSYRPDWQIMWRQISCLSSIGDQQNALNKYAEFIEIFPGHDWITQAFKH